MLLFALEGFYLVRHPLKPEVTGQTYCTTLHPETVEGAQYIAIDRDGRFVYRYIQFQEVEKFRIEEKSNINLFNLSDTDGKTLFPVIADQKGKQIELIDGSTSTPYEKISDTADFINVDAE